MSSKSSVGIPRSTALGMSLLGLSVALFAVDVAGTLALEHERNAASATAGSAVASTFVAPAVYPAEHAVRSAVLSHATHVVAAPRIVAAVQPPAHRSPPPVLPTTKTVFAGNSRPAAAQRMRSTGSSGVVSRRAPDPVDDPHDIVTTAARQRVVTRVGEDTHMTNFVARKRVNDITLHTLIGPSVPIAVDGKRSVARETAEQRDGATTRTAIKPVALRRAAASVVTLREVRRFVMYELKKGDKHVCVISAMTYPVADRQVVVDLVFRDDKGRWSEKAVVRRGGNAVKLIGVKRRPLPYKIVASTAFAASR